MLYFNTISHELHRLLNAIQRDFENLPLVGVTGLALHYGHRESIDLDFFGEMTYETEEIVDKIKNYGELQILKRSQNINVFQINDIKVDFVNYNYKWLEKPIQDSGITLATDKDIAAMKIAAITGRGSKKDFIDLYFLLNHYTLTEMLTMYEAKYPDASMFLALKSLTFFEDAEIEPMPKMLVQVSWEEVKEQIQQEVRQYWN